MGGSLGRAPLGFQKDEGEIMPGSGPQTAALFLLTGGEGAHKDSSKPEDNPGGKGSVRQHRSKNLI
jgi:hypothetical protein